MLRESSVDSARADRMARTGNSADRLRFSGDNAFQLELRRRVDEFFKRTGRRPRDCPQMYFKIATILAAFIVAYALLVFAASTWWQGLLFATVVGFAMAQIGFNIQHDGGHQAVSAHRWVNKLMAMTLDMVGGSSYVWHWKHGVFHHTYVNISGHDSDIDLGILARLAPLQKRLGMHRWQHYYLWVLYGITVLRWHIYGDFRDIVTGRIGDRPFPRPRGWDLAFFVIGKMIFFTLAFGLPLIFHPAGSVILFYALAATVAGLLLALVFQMAHVVEEAAFPSACKDSGRIENAWAIHQLETTVDFARDNRVLGWLIGGLNFQIEHHLFTRICHIHYPALAKVVEATCREFGVKYAENRSFGSGIASHYRWLRRMGRPGPTAAVPSH